MRRREESRPHRAREETSPSAKNLGAWGRAAGTSCLVQTHGAQPTYRLRTLWAPLPWDAAREKIASSRRNRSAADAYISASKDPERLPLGTSAILRRSRLVLAGSAPQSQALQFRRIWYRSSLSDGKVESPGQEGTGRVACLGRYRLCGPCVGVNPPERAVKHKTQF